MSIRQQLVAAKAAHLAIKSPCVSPTGQALAAARTAEKKNAMYPEHKQTLQDYADREAYKKRKAAAAQHVADLQQQLTEHVAREAEVKQREAEVKQREAEVKQRIATHRTELKLQTTDTERRAILTKILELQQSLLPPSDLE